MWQHGTVLVFLNEELVLTLHTPCAPQVTDNSIALMPSALVFTLHTPCALQVTDNSIALMPSYSHSSHRVRCRLRTTASPSCRVSRCWIDARERTWCVKGGEESEKEENSASAYRCQLRRQCFAGKPAPSPFSRCGRWDWSSAGLHCAGAWVLVLGLLCLGLGSGSESFEGPGYGQPNTRLRAIGHGPVIGPGSGASGY